MRRKHLLLLAVLLLVLAVSCDGQAMVESKESLCVASWNVQNLFNAVLDGNEYEEYKPSSGWSQSAYESRLSNASKVLGHLPSASSYIVVLNEIENPDVVEDLIKTGDSAKMGFRYYACAGAEGGAIQTAVVSSIPIKGARVHSVSDDLRPILEVEFDTSYGKLFILAVHFKSNIGGQAETAFKRVESASVVRQISRQIQKESPGCLVMVCGDMNEECWDENCMGRFEYSDCPLKVSDSFVRDFWYCFWLDQDLGLWPGGSYMYNEEWKSYDNILVSQAGKDGTGWEFDSCGIVFEGIIKTADQKPFSWDRSLLRGVSDHLPVWTVFVPSL